MLDFLKEIVEGVPDPSAGGTIDLDRENGEGGRKKRGKGKRAAAASGAPGEPGAPRKRTRKKRVDSGPAVGPSASASVGDDHDPEDEMDGKSEPEGDATMGEGDEYEDEKEVRYGRYGEGSGEYRRQPELVDEDLPYIPKR
jgi:hypothetical protein